MTGVQTCALPICAEGKKIILVFNKIDKISDEEYKVIDEIFNRFDAERIYISAKKRINTDQLEKALIQASQIQELQASDVVVSNIRHYEVLKKAQISIQRVIEGLDHNISHDFLSQDIRECMHHLGEITGGYISTDEILREIFGRFCIGK